MDSFFISLAVSLLAGVLLLAIEYWLIHPQLEKRYREAPDSESPEDRVPAQTPREDGVLLPEFVEYYYKLAVGLLGGREWYFFWAVPSIVLWR